MADYTTEHTSALADLQAAGASVTFTQTTATYAPTTDAFSAPSTTTVTGNAIEEEGNPQLYRDLSLVQRNPVTIFFSPTTIGSLPLPGYTFSWGGVTRTVQQVDPLAPNGVAICATIIGAV